MLRKLSIITLCIILLAVAGCNPAEPDAVSGASETIDAPPAESNAQQSQRPSDSGGTPPQQSQRPSDSGGTPPEPSPSPSQEPEPFVFTADNMPRLDGSTANIPLGQMVLMALLGQSAADAKEGIAFNGTSSAWMNLLNGDADVLLVYEPAEETAQELRYKNTQLEKAPIGRDALVFLVNAQNKTDNLTTAQLQDIYSGAVTNWNQVGGDNLPVLAYQRNPTSGSQALMEKLVLPRALLTEAPAAMVIGEMGGLVDVVAQYDNAGTAIGYNVYYYVSQMKNDPNIKLLSIDGVAPDNASIQKGEYPFVNDFYAAIRADEPENSPARVLFNWLQGSQGQELVLAAGYVPVGP